VYDSLIVTALLYQAENIFHLYILIGVLTCLISVLRTSHCFPKGMDTSLRG